MSQFSVSFGLNSTKIKATPSSTLNDLLTKACSSFKLNVSLYQLKHKNSLVDLSLPVRLANLPQGAKLEIVKRGNSSAASIPVDITVKIQIILPANFSKELHPSNLVNSFSNYSTIDDLLEKFSAINEISLSNLSLGDSNYEPQLQVLTRIIRRDEFHKRLADFGFQKNLLIRINFKQILSELEENAKQDKLLAEQEAINLKQYQNQELRNKLLKEKTVEQNFEREAKLREHKLKEKEDGRSGFDFQGVDVQGLGENDQVGLSKDETQGMKSDKMDIDCSPSNMVQQEVQPNLGKDTKLQERFPEPEEEDRFSIEGEGPSQQKRKIEIYKPSKPLEMFEHPDSTYDMTVSQAKKYQDMLAAKAKPQKLQKNIKPEEIKFCNVRVKFPDQTNLQINFNPDETLNDLYNHVDNMLLAPLKYKLALSHPYKILSNTSQTFLSAKFSNRTLVVFEVENYLQQAGPFLKTDNISVKDLSEADDVKLERERQFLKDDNEETEASKNIANGVIRKSKSTHINVEGDKKFPKWLNLSKK